MAMHMIKAVEGANTQFCPLSNVIDELDPSYEQMYFCTGTGTENYMHPLIYKHPKTGKKTLFFHPRL